MPFALDTSLSTPWGLGGEALIRELHEILSIPKDHAENIARCLMRHIFDNKTHRFIVMRGVWVTCYYELLFEYNIPDDNYVHTVTMKYANEFYNTLESCG